MAPLLVTRYYIKIFVSMDTIAEKKISVYD